MHSSAQPFAVSTISLCEDVRLVACVFLWHLDHDLVDRGLDVGLELVPFLRHDRERRRKLPKSHRELVDLGGRRVSPGEDAEVDAYLDAGFVPLAHEQRDGGFVDELVHAGSYPAGRNS